MNGFFPSTEFLSLAWTFGEVFLLAGIRWVCHELDGEEKRKLVPFALSCLSLCVFCVWMHAGAEPIIRNLLRQSGMPRNAYSTFEWNFFCSLWAALEGAAVLYLFCIYGQIKQSVTGNRYAMVLRENRGFIMGVFLILLITFFVVYHDYSFHLYSKYDLKLHELKNMLRFFRRIIGLFWIAFEGMIAIGIFKVYLLLRRTKQGVQADGWSFSVAGSSF